MSPRKAHQAGSLTTSGQLELGILPRYNGLEDLVKKAWGAEPISGIKSVFAENAGTSRAFTVLPRGIQVPKCVDVFNH